LVSPKTIFKLVREAFVAWRGALSRNPASQKSYAEVTAPPAKAVNGVAWHFVCLEAWCETALVRDS